MTTVEHPTIARPDAVGWAAVNHAGQPRRVPASALGEFRLLRAGQRVRAELDAAGAVVRVALP